ncbi:MAG: pyrroline-5-carboxylate reductase [Phycisphaerales bacterium]|nr:MAG: pyrroline-5-carboxylate reductase [Phycisphaerales bacterium]
MPEHPPARPDGAQIDRSVVSIGAGNMARAILLGAVERGVIEPGLVTAADPNPPQRAVFEAVGARTAETAAVAVASCPPDAAVLLAVKPQMLAGVAEELPAGAMDGRLVISILAGTTGEGVQRAFGGGCRVVRVMPNTPARVGRGMSAVCAGPGATEEDLAFVERLFGAVGEVVRLEEELMDAFTGVAGSGPAYVFYLVEAMTAGAIATGIEPADAARIARATVIGAARLLEASPDESAEALRASVTSKNGTTFAATESLDRDGVRDAFVRAILAARDRGRELGQG